MTTHTVRPQPEAYEARGRTAPASLRTPLLRWRVELLVFVTALAARTMIIFRHHALDALFGYDSGVYFAGADSVVHGRLPYADYVQLHPPGITVFLTPFTLLTTNMSDSAAFSTTLLAFCLLGSLNAVLVVRVCRRLGFGARGALIGGMFYALWIGAAGVEFLIKLETVGNLLLLAALLLSLRAERRDAAASPHCGRWARLGASAVAGVPLGLAVSVKIWWVVPVVGVLCWHGLRLRSPRRSAAMTVGALVSTTAINLPFFLIAPRRMFSMVVIDQLLRTRPASASLPIRFWDLTGAGFLPAGQGVGFYPLFAIAGVLFVGASVLAWRVRPARAAVVLAVLQLFVVLIAPSWFEYYSDYLAVSASVIVAAASAASAAARRTRRGGDRSAVSMRTRAGRGVPLALVAVIGALTAGLLGTGVVAATPFSTGPALARAVASAPCVMTDSPAIQIRLDALTRGLTHGCPNWVDVTGPTYGPYRSAAPRTRNVRWQRAFLAYLRRGQAVVLIRGRASGETAAFRQALAKAGRPTEVGGYLIYHPGG